MAAESPPSSVTTSGIARSAATIAWVRSMKLTKGHPRLLQVLAVLRLGRTEDCNLIRCGEADHIGGLLCNRGPAAGFAGRILGADDAARCPAKREISHRVSGHLHIADRVDLSGELALDKEVAPRELLAGYAIGGYTVIPTLLLLPDHHVAD